MTVYLIRSIRVPSYGKLPLGFELEAQDRTELLTPHRLTPFCQIVVLKSHLVRSWCYTVNV